MFGALYGVFKALPEVSSGHEKEISRHVGLGEPEYTRFRDRTMLDMSIVFPELFAWLQSQRRDSGIEDEHFDFYILLPFAGLTVACGGVEFLPDPELTGFDLQERRRRLFESRWTEEFDSALLALHGDNGSWIGFGLSKLTTGQRARLGKMIVTMAAYLNWIFGAAELERTKLIAVPDR